MPIVANRIGVSSSPATGEAFLRDLSFTLRKGELTVVVGAAGSGKSTLLDALAGIRPLQAGTVTYDGKPLWRKKRVDPDVNRRIGAVFQQPGQGLFAATVLRELRYSLRPLRLQKADEEACIAASITAFGLSADVLARSPFTLSGGQQRRVGLASAVVTSPEWLFLDEPTTGLDPAAAAALAEWLVRRRAAEPKSGIVIATHDLDTFLPAADRVLVLRAGEIVVDEVPTVLAEKPELLLQAGIGIPAYMETAVLLRRLGLGAQVSASADATADSLSHYLSSVGTAQRQSAAAAQMLQMDGAAAPIGSAAQPGHTSEPHAAAPGLGAPPSVAAAARRTGWAYRLDPRVKWLLLLLVTTGMLAQRSWSGIAWSAAAAAVIVAVSKIPLRGYKGLFAAYILFSVLSLLVSGTQVSALLAGEAAWFVRTDALASALSLLRFLPAMLLGLLFAESTSPMELKRGLEQCVPQRANKGGFVPVEAMSYSAAMMFQFIPLLSAQWERFSRIVRVRGKSGAKPGRVAARDIPAVLAPLLIASLQLAERLSLAVEARGYRLGKPRTSSVTLRFTRLDYFALAAGVALSAALWFIR